MAREFSDLRLFVGRVIVENDGDRLVVGQFEAAPAVRRQAMFMPDLHDRRGGNPNSLRHRANGPRRCLLSRCLKCQRHDLLNKSPSSSAMPGGLLLSRRRPSTLSDMKRSCQRQTQGLDFPFTSMMANVPRPSPLIKI